MTRRFTLMLLMLVVATGAVRLAAHDEFRIIGTLEKHQDSTIAVKKNTGTTVSIKIDKQTAISQNNKKVAASALRVGQSLVVDSYGDTEEGSLALEIRIVPPIRRGSE
jgi:hypothetical protein